MIDKIITEIKAKEYYERNDIIFLDELKRDWFVKYRFSYDQWLENWDKSSTILLMGLQRKPYFLSYAQQVLPDKQIKDIHCFYNASGGWSFKEHSDEVNVYLYVLKGSKNVYIDGELFKLRENQGIHIPEGVKHRVDSLKDTWALSIGY